MYSSMETTASSCFAFIAEPMAANRWEFSGAMISSSVSFSVRMNALRSSGRKWSGPPKKATFPRMGLPQARPEMVWLTTAWKMEAERSSFVAPSLMRGWMSVLANTPQRAAMG